VYDWVFAVLKPEFRVRQTPFISLKGARNRLFHVYPQAMCVVTEAPCQK
jgi:hypothetical protein